MYIKPLITYCCEPLITCSKLNVEKLERLQNQALRLITGAVKTTPIEAMLCLTNNKPIEEIIKEKALILLEKLIRLPSSNYWREYNTNQLRKLKTQQGFIQKVTEYRLELEIYGTPEKLLPMLNPTDLPCIRGNTELLYPIRKKESGDKELYAYAMETINTRYPIGEWLHVYTDGSRLSLEENAGAGVYSELFAFYTSLGNNATAFDGEVQAINIATQQLIIRDKDFKKAVILSDSISAIQAIISFKTPESKRIDVCRKNFKLLTERGKEVQIQWIPAHCGIYGNEVADQLAKKGTKIVQISNNETPFGSISRIIKRKLNFEYEKRKLSKIENKEWKNTISHIPTAPRRTSVALFRLATGHDCLPHYLFRFGILESPNCCICGEDVVFNTQHLLLCPALSSNCISGRYWEARDLLRTAELRTN